MLGRRVYTAVVAALVAAISLTGTVAAGPSSSSPVEVLETHRQPALWNGQGTETLRNIRDSIVAGLRHRASPVVQKTNASLDLSWSNAELFN